MPSALVPIRGRPLFVESSGSGPPFLAMHGLGGSTNLFPLASAVSSLGQGYTVVRFDFEGAGKSPLSDKGAQEGLKMEEFVEDAKAVLEWAGKAGEKAVVFGHSLGAAVALHLAATYPDLVSHLVLSCPSMPRAGDPAGVEASLNLAKLAREKGPFEMADFTAMKNTAPLSSVLARALVRTAMQESTPEGYAQTCEMISRTGAPDWAKIEVPVRIVAGREDQISSVEQGEKVKASLTASESIEVIPVDAGHQPAIECPETVLSILKDFLT
ncbi:hypothetical protein JCM8097_008296 [Rhodosporidiobolus ruineniae]